MIIRLISPADTEPWLAMRLALWPETAEDQQRREMTMMLTEAHRFAIFVCEDPEGDLVGFAEVSLREWAEGCQSSPVGYLEGWYVADHARRQGIGRALLAASEDWVRSRGCREMGSDTDLGNTISESAHQRLGFQVAAHLIAFRKDLDVP
jgi:aminoglycoside 6'-N-acetyltransferase I